jgi:transposase
MTRQQYDADFKARAVEWVARQTKPARVIAEELGVPRKTLYHWMEATCQHPDEPFVGHGHLRADEQRLRDLERAVRDLTEENAILKKRCASSPTARSKVRVHSRSPLQLLGPAEVSGAAGLPTRG